MRTSFAAITTYDLDRCVEDVTDLPHNCDAWITRQSVIGLMSPKRGVQQSNRFAKKVVFTFREDGCHVVPTISGTGKSCGREGLVSKKEAPNLAERQASPREAVPASVGRRPSGQGFHVIRPADLSYAAFVGPGALGSQ